MTNDSQSGREEESTSGISFPSLNKFISQDVDNVVNSSASEAMNHGDTMNAKAWIDGDTNTTSSNQNYFKNYDYDDTDEDGYPTDEYTINSAQSRGKETKRMNFLQLARDRLAARGGADQRDNLIIAQDGNADDDSFLANVNIEDIDRATNDDDFLNNVQVEDVEQQSNDSSFLVHAGFLNSSAKSGRRSDETVADSRYDLYASTLSKADSTNAATLGDLISRESPMAGEVENQSIDTYSYNRAFLDNATIGESNFTSNCSALTDDYCYDARKVGMSEAIKINVIHEGESYGDCSKKSYLGNKSQPIAEGVPESDHSIIDSLPAPAPPPPRNSSQMDDFTAYENFENLARIVSFGESGYVDEEAAMRYAAANRGYCNCGWFTSSSRLLKLVVLCSTFMFLASITSLALAFFWPDLINDAHNESSLSSRWDEASNVTDDNKQEGPPRAGDIDDQLQSASVLEECYDGAQCSEEGTRCTDGSIESCCGETYDSFICDCAIIVEGTLRYRCIFTDVCVDPLCDNVVPEVSTAPPWIPSNEPSHLLIFTDSPSTRPSFIPTKIPTLKPTILPTPLRIDIPLTEQVPTVNPISIALDQIAELMQTVTVKVAKDTYVVESNTSTNFGASVHLRVDESPKSWMVVTFDVSSAVNEYTQLQRSSHSASQNEPRSNQVLALKRAKLRLYSLDEGGEVIISALPNAQRWTETSLTWESVDNLNRSDEFQVAFLDWTRPLEWNEVDVTDAFAMNEELDAVMTFMIKTTSYNGISFASRERDSGVFSPELVLTLDYADASEAILFHSLAIATSPTFSPSSLWPTYSPTIDD